MLNNNVNILGKNNFVDPSAKNVSITGDNNQVLGKIKNVVILGDNITVTESDTIFVDGAMRRDNSKARGANVVRAESNLNVNIEVEQYLVDTSAGDVTLNMESIFLTGQIYKGYTVNVMKTASENYVRFTSGNNITINGLTNAKIKSKNTNWTLWYEGFGRMYIIAGGFTDHHSGYKLIESTSTITIDSDKQMINYGIFTIDGTLIVDGDLILQ